MSVQNLKITIFDGPSVVAPYPVLVAEFAFPAAVLSKDFMHALEMVLGNMNRQVPLEKTYRDAGELIAGVTAALLSLDAPGRLRGHGEVSGQGRVTVTVEYFSAQLATVIVQCVINIVTILFSSGAEQNRMLKQQLHIMQRSMQAYDPGWNNISMMASAVKLGIPFFPVDDSMNFFCYGQGNKSRFSYESSSERDSLVGRIISVNKGCTVQVLASMGYPVPKQMVIVAREQLGPVVNQLGYPLVVKPVTGSKGRAVTSNIGSEAELLRAFQRASAQSPSGVVIEKHIDGFDHRLTVASGQLIGATLKKPPVVTGDGVHTIEQLIMTENESRSAELKKQGLIKDIVVDEVSSEMLGSQGMTLASVPEKGREVRLRTNANLATGGSVEFVLERVHPENARMAIDIARNLRLDVIGIDFITRDITRPWYEEGAVIEVNCTPGVMNKTAEGVLRRYFPDDDSARIKSSLFISDNTDLSDSRFSFDLNARNTGYTSSHKTLLNGGARRLADGSLLKRCRALLMDPDCHELVIVMSLAELSGKGLPVDRFDTGYIDRRLFETEDGLSEIGEGRRCRNLLIAHCSEIKTF